MGQELFQHANLGRSYIHQIVNWVFVNTAARMDPANNFTYLDLHKACYDNETQEYYVLQLITPVTFVPVWKLISAVEAQGEANTLYKIGTGVALNGPKVGVTLGIRSITGVANKTTVTQLPDGTVAISVADNLSVPFANITGVPAYLPASYVPPLATSSTDGTMSAAQFNKLAGIQDNATANATNAQLRDRATHTGTQTASTISDFLEASQDAIGATVVAGVGITVDYNDALGTLQVSNTAALSLGTMASQNANAVAVTGGAIDGTTIGATTRATGRFTSVDASLGVKFGNVANADPLVLNHYERDNTFTPSIIGSGSAGAATYSVRSGFWARLGDDIYGEMSIAYSAHTGVGNMRVTGLPLPSNSTLQRNSVVHTYMEGAGPGAGLIWGNYIPPGSSEITIRTLSQAAGAIGSLALPPSLTYMMISFRYPV